MAGRSIKHLVDECREQGLIFDVVESIPVTEEIKLGRPKRDRHIEKLLRVYPQMCKIRD